MVTILVGARLRDSCKKILNILPLVSQYIVNNKFLFRLNSDILTDDRIAPQNKDTAHMNHTSNYDAVSVRVTCIINCATQITT